MEQPVFPVAPKIQKQKCQQQLRYEGKPEPLQQSWWLILRKGINTDRYDESGNYVADQKQADIAGPAARRLNRLALKSAHSFQQHKKEQGREKNKLKPDFKLFSH